MLRTVLDGIEREGVLVDVERAGPASFRWTSRDRRLSAPSTLRDKPCGMAQSLIDWVNVCVVPSV